LLAVEFQVCTHLFFLSAEYEVVDPPGQLRGVHCIIISIEAGRDGFP
jgi:hypothetical protein